MSSCRDHAVLLVKFYCRDEVLVGFNSLLFLPEVQVPNPDRLVVRCRVQVLPCRVHRQPLHPVIVPDERVQQLPRVNSEQTDQLVTTCSEDEHLLVRRDPVDSLLLQLLQGVDFGLLGKFIFQKL